MGHTFSWRILHHCCVIVVTLREQHAGPWQPPHSGYWWPEESSSWWAFLCWPYGCGGVCLTAAVGRDCCWTEMGSLMTLLHRPLYTSTRLRSAPPEMLSADCSTPCKAVQSRLVLILCRTVTLPDRTLSQMNEWRNVNESLSISTRWFISLRKQQAVESVTNLGHVEDFDNQWGNLWKKRKYSLTRFSRAGCDLSGLHLGAHENTAWLQPGKTERRKTKKLPFIGCSFGLWMPIMYHKVPGWNPAGDLCYISQSFISCHLSFLIKV